MFDMLSNGDFKVQRGLSKSSKIRTEVSEFERLLKEHDTIRKMGMAVGLVDDPAMSRNLRSEPRKPIAMKTMTVTGHDGSRILPNDRFVPGKRLGQTPPPATKTKAPVATTVDKGSKSEAPTTRIAFYRNPAYVVGGPGRADYVDGFSRKFPTDRSAAVGRSRYDNNKSGDAHKRVCGNNGNNISVGLTREDKDRQVKTIYRSKKLPDRLAGNCAESVAALKRNAQYKEIAKTNKELMKRIINAKPFVSTFREK